MPKQTTQSITTDDWISALDQASREEEAPPAGAMRTSELQALMGNCCSTKIKERIAILIKKGVVRRVNVRRRNTSGACNVVPYYVLVKKK